MSYIGNNLQVAYPSYTNIDDISGSFNGVTTSFALTVGGVAPVPAPLSSNQCMISVGGVVQRPDDTGSEGFRLSGGNIVFSSAPNTAEDFFGVILAGADYVNVGVNYPSGTASTPSITFDTDLDTGIYNPAANQLGITCAGSLVSTFTSAGQSILSGSAAAPSLFVTGDTNTGIYSPGADSIAISTGGTQRATVDSSGRLLVGTSSARAEQFSGQARIQTAGTNYYGLSSFQYSNDATENVVSICKSRGGSVGTQTVVQNNDKLGQIRFQGSDGTGFVTGAHIEAAVDGTPGANDMPGRLVFSTTADGASSPTERMRIFNGGGFSVYSSTTSNDTIDSCNNQGAGTTYSTFIGRHSATSTQSGTVSVRIYTNGNIQNTNGSYTTLSDAKLKENIVDATSQWDDLKAIKIRNWNFKEETGHETHRQIGPIAQELEAVCPGLVFETHDRDKDGNETGEVTKGVNQSVLYMKAVKALQEAMERIETLEAKVAALEA